MPRFKDFTDDELNVLEEALINIDMDEDEFYDATDKETMSEIADRLRDELRTDAGYD